MECMLDLSFWFWFFCLLKVNFSSYLGESLYCGKLLRSLQVVNSLFSTKMTSGDDLDLDLILDSGVSLWEGGLNTAGFFILLLLLVK